MDLWRNLRSVFFSSYKRIQKAKRRQFWLRMQHISDTQRTVRENIINQNHWPCYRSRLTHTLSVTFSVSPPKKSRGKPALSKVPFLDTVNGDTDYTGTGMQWIWMKCRITDNLQMLQLIHHIVRKYRSVTAMFDNPCMNFCDDHHIEKNTAWLVEK